VVWEWVGEAHRAAKVGDLRSEVGVEQDVLGVEVPVEDVAGVKVGHAHGHLVRNRDPLHSGEAMLRFVDGVVQAAALAQLEDEADPRPHLAGVLQARPTEVHDVWMRNFSEDPELQQRLPDFWIFGLATMAGSDVFDCDLIAFVGAPVHLTKRASSNRGHRTETSERYALSCC
jgi:hypothetical protein